MTTATAAPVSPDRAVRGQGSALTGTGTLVRFFLRRDRIRIPAWTAGIVAMSLGVNANWEQSYGSPEQIQEIARTLDSPAMVAMVGVNHAGVENTTYGTMMAQQMFWFTLIAVAIMSIMLVVRHTRAEEETNRAELVRAGVVGRHSYVTAALIVVGIANLAVGVLTAAGLGAMNVPSVDWAGSWLYGAGHVAVGMTFAAVAAVTAQITGYSRGANGMAFAVLGIAYVLRAMGDVGENALSWLSPIGWAQATKVYVDNLWWPLLIAVVACVALAALAYNLSIRRDVGSGLRAARLGPAGGSAALTTPTGFALRLHRGLIIGFGVAMLLLGASYGSILGDAEDMLNEVQAFQDLVQDIEGSVVEAFAAVITTIMAIISSIYVVLAMQRPRSEETSGRAEPILATAVSRTRWLGSHVAVAVVAGSAMLVFTGLGFGGAGASSAGESSLLGDLVVASLAYAPAAWFVIGVSVVLFGWAPRAMMLTWVIVVYSIIVVYLGDALQLPEWMKNLSPFGHVPQLPAEDFNAVPLLVLTALAAGLIALGLRGFAQRDLETK